MAPWLVFLLLSAFSICALYLGKHLGYRDGYNEGFFDGHQEATHKHLTNVRVLPPN